MALCGLCTEVQDALYEGGGQLVLVDRSCHPNGDREVTSVPLECPWCVAMCSGEELETLWTSQDMKGHR